MLAGVLELDSNHHWVSAGALRPQAQSTAEFLQCSSRAAQRAQCAERAQVPAWQWTWPLPGQPQWSQPPANLEPPWQWPALAEERRDTGRVPLLERELAPHWRAGDSTNISTAWLPDCTLKHQVLYFGLEFLLAKLMWKLFTDQNQRLGCLIWSNELEIPETLMFLSFWITKSIL